MLELVPLETLSTSEIIYQKMLEIFDEYELNLSKLVSVTADGAQNLSGKHNGLVSKLNAYLQDKNIDREIIKFHCILKCRLFLL